MEQSAALLAELARPTSSYKQRAWLAMSGLATFMSLYLLLAIWFLFTAYRLTFGAATVSNGGFFGYIVGACAVFLAVFMLKAIFFVKRGGTDDSIEVTAEQQPKLFEFLYQLADRADAPRPHKVFLSARVNAAVFYDLSIVNLLLPSKKNLEIGLGLVNALSIGELRAVLAHEFGHFAQRAMAVGRWVYIAQQIAGHLVARRDKLDDFLRGLSRFDFRIAWVGWILSLIVWSIRSLVESAFNVVVIMQRALSREMEMQADLVAVSLTGSDALIHALHRLQAADDSWGRAWNFAARQRGNQRLTSDVFAVQSRVQEHMALILNDPHYIRVPSLPAQQPEQHRVFKAELAQPPQMWLTHPLNHEREANAKRHYVAAPIDQGSAWDIFDDPARLRQQVSAKLFDAGEATLVSIEESLLELDKEFDREHLKPAYRGVYYGRSPVQAIAHASDLYRQDAKPDDLDGLYPESLTQDMAQLAQLEKEISQLRALHSGVLKSSGNAINLRGKVLKPKQLPQAIKDLEQELNTVLQRLQAHDHLCRSTHLAAAEQLGNGWGAYLQGLLALLHYAEHTAANLRDAQGLLRNTIHIATATRRVNEAGVDRILASANALYAPLEEVFKQSDQLVLDTILRQRMPAGEWKEQLGELKLVWATRANINDWLNVIDSWVDQAAGACSTLRLHTLEQLLISESVIAKNFRQGKAIIPAPTPSQVPADYPILIPGQERTRQQTLDWWARFQTADGIVPALARLGVAGGIVAAVLGLGGSVGSASLTIYNGLARPVVVQIDHKRLHVAALSSANAELDANRSYQMTASTEDGKTIESFKAEAKGSFAHFVYNVAGASPLVEWTSVYGNAPIRPDRPLGAPRWSTTEADVLFSDPPKSVQTKSGGATRQVLAGLGNVSASRQLDFLQNPVEQQALISVHARWDTSSSANIAQWLELAAHQPDFPKLLATRLLETPNDVWLLRIAHDVASDAEKVKICARYQLRSKAAPQDPDLLYLAARCLPDVAEKNSALREGYERWPTHGWLAYAHGYGEAELAHWSAALSAFSQARRALPSLNNWIALDEVRIQRLLHQASAQQLAELAKDADGASMLLALETDTKLEPLILQAYQALAHGQFADALRLANDKPETAARMLRLIAASDGATPAQIARAQALNSTQGIDDSSVWSSVALAMRTQRDFSPYLTAIKNTPSEHVAAIQNFLKALHTNPDIQAAEHMLDGLTPELRGQAYSAALVLLGNNAPKEWRDAAKRLLFASERPYFV